MKKFIISTLVFLTVITSFAVLYPKTTPMPSPDNSVKLISSDTSSEKTVTEEVHGKTWDSLVETLKYNNIGIDFQVNIDSSKIDKSKQKTSYKNDESIKETTHKNHNPKK